ncbi:hypothetical protein H257_14735 [Aphanomyces astaci]|uniref:Uncharacterized protein n=1 Tax=Aphanomyces astaci TaxID=112090 RepID=W4FQ47_APHAT|nr:hypothetical protein H257_14735 [Aphanomyces astaci]ETV69597.1 hypothetical protein H257_14735 [Aphanomyces astaci]|eukprot:XP_009840924.1 hypothetical protein H257_14735 [Aphanomyces astaci]
MADQGKKRKASKIAEDADDSVEEAEAPAQQVEVVDLIAESDDDGGVAPSEDTAEVTQRKADWEAKAAVKRERTGGDEGVQKLLEQHLAREEAVKKAKAAEEVKAKTKRAKEAKAIAAAAAKAADETAKEAAEAASKAASEGEAKASGKGATVKTASIVKAELGGSERTGLARDEVFKRELAFHWDRSRIFSPAGWGGVDLGYVRDGYQTANATGVERYLRLFASAQWFELHVLWMLLAVESVQLARVSFHRFDEFKGAMHELHERERLERWTVDVGRIELCNDETLLEYFVAFVLTLVGQGSGRHGQLPLTAGRLANSMSNFAGVRRHKHGRLYARSVARMAAHINMRHGPEVRATSAQVAARLSVARPMNPFAEYNPPSGRQQGGQLTAVKWQAAADYRAGARAIAAPQQCGADVEDGDGWGEEPLRDPEDRLPSLHRS